MQFKNSLLRLVKLSLLVMIATLTISGGCTRYSRTNSTHSSDTLRFAIDMDMPGYFVLSGEQYGYQYELSDKFADESKQQLKVLTGLATKSIKKGLEDGSIDVAATLSSSANELSEVLSMPIYKTSYVLLAPARYRKPAGDNLSSVQLIGNSRLLVSSGFQATKSYDVLLDSLPQAHFYPSSKSGFDLMDLLSSGDYDLLICEKSEAQIGCALNGNVKQIYEFDDVVSMSLLFANKHIMDNFTEWYDNYRCGEEYAMLNYLYFDQGVVGQLTGKHDMNRRSAGGISVWDELIRDVCGREGVDWRLVSAIAYNESYFRSWVVSERGAVGLMQLMPVVAREFNVEEEDMANPEINIMLAAKLLKKMERMFKFGSGISTYDRNSIILAGYNCGVGRVLQARRVVGEEGGDPNLWSDVAECLRRMGNEEYVNQYGVKGGIFRNSGQTLAYVDKVMGKYESYCSTSK